VVNAIFGAAEPHNSFWNTVIEELPQRVRRLRDAGNHQMNHQIGPLLLTEIYRRHPADVVLLPSETFNPLHWSRIPLGESADGLWSFDSLPETTIGVHTWHHRRIQRSNVVS